MNDDIRSIGSEYWGRYNLFSFKGNDAVLIIIEITYNQIDSSALVWIKWHLFAATSISKREIGCFDNKSNTSADWTYC